MSDPSQQQKREAIATALGWTKIGDKGFGSSSRVGCSPREPSWPFTPIPEFDKDLNACHTAELALSDEQHHAFRYFLRKITRPTGFDMHGWAGGRAFSSATAAQRAEAIFQAISITQQK
jgi:hypothetical protein